jgi:hypothetical protein
MSFSISVTNIENNSSWSKNLTETEYQNLKPLIKGYDTVFAFRATLMPVRTNNLSNFAKDFFLPTVVNHAIEVQGVVGRIFAILGALILDSVTFPVRLLTCIPRVISNARQPENLFKKYLKAQDVEPRVLESGSVKAELNWMTRPQSSSRKRSYYVDESWNLQEKLPPYNQKHSRISSVHFIEVPNLKRYCGSSTYTKSI